MLNALRHHSYLHCLTLISKLFVSGAQRLTASQLSTCARLPVIIHTHPSAQRLTASQLSTFNTFSQDVYESPCSTPYGITAIYILRPAKSPPERDGVLNALRHHSYLHPVGGVARFRREVLNALRHHSYLHIGSSNPQEVLRNRAQRLTASQLSTFRSIGDRNAGTVVLNALRHHSYLHISASAISFSVLPCSTPYGITAIYMEGILRGRGGFESVLNALRHHSYLHLT